MMGQTRLYSGPRGLRWENSYEWDKPITSWIIHGSLYVQLTHSIGSLQGIDA